MRRGETRTDIRNEAARERARVCVSVPPVPPRLGEMRVSLKQIMKEKEAATWPIINTQIRLSCNWRRVVRTEKHVFDVFTFRERDSL